MRTWKLILEYDGTQYSGWQEQNNARTVMGDLRIAAEKYFRSEVDLQGAGRTDAGVHAAAQVAHLRCRTARKHPGDEVARELNDALPSTIAVIEAREVPNKFHARRDAVSRTYVYQISRRKSAFSKKFVWWIKEPLDVAAMAKGAALLAGRHDFSCFRQADPGRPDDPVVAVESASVEEEDGLIVFRIEASHFLWRMVRRLAGTLVKLGRGEITEADFRKLLQGRAPAHCDVAAWTAPAAGLFLERVRYP